MAVFFLFAAVLFGMTPAEASIPKADSLAPLAPLALEHTPEPSITPSRFGFAESVSLLDVEHAPRVFSLDAWETSRCEITYARNNPLKYIDPNGLDAIPVAFPEYRVQTPVGRLGLGHAGIILINNKSGATRYYEYGRYDSQNRGVVRRGSVPNVTMGADGYPTTASLKNLFDVVRQKSGHGGPLEGVYIKDDHYAEMVKYAEGREAQNNDSNRESYGLLGNNCMTFAKECVESVGISTPMMINPSPGAYMQKWENSVSGDSSVNEGAAKAVKVCNNDGCHFEIR